MMMGFRSIFSISLIKKGLRNLKERGFSDTLRKTKSRILPGSIYREWMKTPLFTDEELASQREHTFTKEILFSITVPLYNTPEPFLREMIDSVLQQTYSGWELCLADGSDSQHAYTGEICREYCKKDGRETSTIRQ